MNRPAQKFSRAGGSLLAISIIAGVVGGTIAGEPSVGFLVGLGAGVAMALFIWLSDRRPSQGPVHQPDQPADDLER